MPEAARYKNFQAKRLLVQKGTPQNRTLNMDISTGPFEFEAFDVCKQRLEYVWKKQRHSRFIKKITACLLFGCNDDCVRQYLRNFPRSSLACALTSPNVLVYVWKPAILHVFCRRIDSSTIIVCKTFPSRYTPLYTLLFRSFTYVSIEA